MRRFLFLIALLAVGFNSCRKNPGDEPKTPEEPTVSETPSTNEEVENPDEIIVSDKLAETKIAQFFAASLEKNPSVFSYSTPFEIASYDDYKDSIWQFWKDANANFSEEHLISLGKLSDKNAGSFEMPAGSEPKTTMNYYFGQIGGDTPYGRHLCIYLHGGIGEEDNTEWDAAYDWALHFFGASYISYFIPKMPCSNPVDYNRWHLKGKQAIYEKLFRQTLLEDESEYNHQIFFAGQSQGAYGSQRLASFYADYLVGVAPVAGGEPLIDAPAENCANIIFTLTTGSLDTDYGRDKLTKKAQEAFDKLAAEHPGYYKHSITIQEGLEHANVNPTMHIYELKDWRNERNPMPKYVYWENFPMDEVYRKGFYNLQVLEPSADYTGDKIRTCYEEILEEQTITLNVKNVTYTPTSEKYEDITLDHTKNYTEATSGKLRIYLAPELVDLTKNVKIILNGKEVFDDIPTVDAKFLVESCALFYDKYRLFPAAIDVEIK